MDAFDVGLCRMDVESGTRDVLCDCPVLPCPEEAMRRLGR